MPSDSPEVSFVRESIGQTIATIRVIAGLTVFTASLVFISWIVEYLVTGTDFAWWIQKRWYIPAFILLVTAYSYIRLLLEKNSEWESLQALSSDVQDHFGFIDDNASAAGPLVFSGRNLGHVSVVCNRSGMGIYKGRTLRVFLSWSRIQRIEYRSSAADSLEAEFKIKMESSNLAPNLTVPWSSRMNAYVGASVRQNTE